MSGDSLIRPPAAPALRRHWWALPLAGALIIACAAAFGLVSFWKPLHEGWTNPYGAFSHGYLVLAMSVWMGIAYWRDRPPGQLRPDLAGFAVLVAVVFAAVVMDALFLNATRMVLLPILVLATIAAVFGRECALRLAWPVAFLYCALPQWWVINGTLQTLTSTVVSALVRLTGLAANVEGNYIHVPAGTFEVASGCSGLSFVIAALSLAGFQALMYLRSWRRGLVLCVVAVALAILANWTRVYALIIVGIETRMQHYLIQVEHLYFGWAIFMVLMVPMFVLGARWSVRPPRSGTGPATGKHPPVVSRGLPLAAAAAGLVLLVPRVLAPLETDNAADSAVASLPQQIGDSARGEDASGWSPVFAGAHLQQAAYVEDDGQTVSVLRAVYPHQTREQRLVSGENDFFGPGWQRIEEAAVDVDLPDRRLTVIESRGYMAGRESLVWSWYAVAGHTASTKLDAKLYEALGLVQGRRDAAAFGLSTACVPDCDAAHQRLQQFAGQAGAGFYAD